MQRIPDQRIKEGDTLSITCRVSSANPAPSEYKWSKVDDNTFSHTGPVLTISNVQRSNAGTYRCTAVNTMVQTSGGSQRGSDTEDVVVDVQCMYLIMLAVLCNFVFSLFLGEITIFIVFLPSSFQRDITK